MTETGKTLMRNSTYIFLSGMISSATMVIYYPILARILTVEEMGNMVALSLTYVFFSFLFPLSLEQASIYFSSKHLGQRDDKGAWSRWRGFRNIGILLSVVAGTGGYFLVNAMLALMGLAEPLYAVLLTISIAMVVLRGFYASAAYVKERFDVIFRFNIANLTLRVPTILLLIIWGWGLIGILVGWIVGDLLLLCLYSIWTRRNIPKSKAHYLIMESAKYSGPIYGAALFTYFSDNIERLILVTVIGSEELAIYTSAIIAFGVLHLGLKAITQSVFPRMIALNQHDDSTQLKLLVSKAGKFTLLLFLPAALGIAYFSRELLAIALGPDYVSGATSLIILMLGVSLCLPYMLQQTALMAAGRTQKLSLARLIGLLTNLALSLGLISTFGIHASAIGRVGSLLSVFIIQSLFLRGMGPWLATRDNAKIAFSSLAALGIVIIVEMFLLFIGPLSMFLKLALMPVLFMTYVLLIRLTNALDDLDCNLLVSLVPPILGLRAKGFVAILVGCKSRNASEGPARILQDTS